MSSLPVLVLLYSRVLSEIIDINTTNTNHGQNIQCTEPSCVINCNADNSCTSSFIDQSTTTIHCPSIGECEECTIHCKGKYSCYKSNISLHNCTKVNIYAYDSYSLSKAIINTDKGSTEYDYTGYLSISNFPPSGAQQVQNHTMSELTIENLNIANITINCHAATLSYKECDHIKMNNNMHSTDITLNCHENTDCSFSEIYCPVDTVKHEQDNTYHSNCNLTCKTDTKCNDISIYAQHGIPADFWFDCDADDPYSCQGSTVYCGKQYTNKCDMTYSNESSSWFCDDVDDGLSCVDTEWVDDIYKQQTIKAEDFWINTSYGIPMTILAGAVILCLIFMVTKILRQRAKERARGMMRYEIEDAKEADEQNKVKRFMRGIVTKVMGNKYGVVADDEYDEDEEDYQRRVELENLEKMTKSQEDHDSDDDLELEAIEGGRTDNETFGYSYGHTFAVHDL